jgi:hypothetical protein
MIAVTMHLPWFRFYTEFATDPVMQSLAFEDQRHFVILLCLKGSGLMDRKISQQARNRIILRGLGLDQGAGDEVKRRLIDVNLIDKNWFPRGWEDRQFSSDTSTERVRKYRKTASKTAFHQGTEEACGSAAESTEMVRKYRESKGTGNVSVTDVKRSETVPRAREDQNRSEQIRVKKDPPLNHPSKKKSSCVGVELREKAAPSTQTINGSGIFMETCTGELWEVPAVKVTEWQDSFPDVDVPLTLLGARQWLRDHPKRRKTALGMVAFLGDWMRREQDKPDPRASGKSA